MGASPLFLVTLTLVVERGRSAGLLRGESQERGFDVSSQAPPAALHFSTPSGLGEGEVSPYEAQRAGFGFKPSNQVIKQRFSLETTTAATTPHYEALVANSSEGLFFPRSRDVEEEFNYLKRRFGGSSTEASRRSYEEQVSNNVHTSGPNIIREEDLDGTLGSLSYASPTPNARGNVRYSLPTYTTPGTQYQSTRGGKQLERGFIPPTTYRPNYQRDYPPAYSRGSVKFSDYNGVSSTTERPFVSAVGRSGYRYPTTPNPLGNAYSYSFVTTEPTVVSTSSLAYDDPRSGSPFPTTENLLRVYSPARPTPDGSYVFTYNAGDHMRHESRDQQGGVRGTYRFQGTDGAERAVEYEAGAGRGFVARGPHLLVTEEGSPEDSYFFSYDAGDHARQESRDRTGRVIGSYSFLTGDGLRQTVHYEADPVEGFRIKSTHLSDPRVYKR